MPLRRLSGSLFFAVLALASPAQEPQTPELARARKLLHDADAARASGDHESARGAVREAFAGCLALRDLDARDDAHELLFDIGRAAELAGDLRTAHDAYERVCAHRTRTAPDDDPALQNARTNLAITKHGLGDLRGALAIEEQVFEVFSRTLPDDHRDLQKARQNLATTKYRLGDVRGARALLEKVFAVLSQTLSDDDRELQNARQNLALTKKALGDLRGALALEEKVFEVRSKTLPDDHPELQSARANLASTKETLGDLRGALALEEKVFEVRSRSLPDDHPDLQRARHNLAVTKTRLGDLQGALVLQERVSAVLTGALPDDHPHLQAARGNLAATKRALGDLRGALVLEEAVFAVFSRTLPDDHRYLQAARGNLAVTKKALGDLRGALPLEQKILAVAESLPDDHPELLAARLNLAATKRALGELRDALALEEKVLAIPSIALADDHPDLQTARQGLALTKCALGDLQGALELEQQVFAVRSRTLPDDHPELQTTRGSLAWIHAMLGSTEVAAELALERATASRHRLAGWTLAPRAAGAMALHEQPALDLLLTLAQGFDDIEATAELAPDALLVSQTLRGAQTRTARHARRARSVDIVRAETLERELRAAVDLVSRVASATPRSEDEGVARTEHLAGAVQEKERLQRDLVALAARAGVVDAAAVTIEDLAGALPERSVAAAIVSGSHPQRLAAQSRLELSEARLTALVLDRDGTVSIHPLGPLAPIEALVAGLRAEAGAGRDRGLVPVANDALATQRALRALVLDPIVAAARTVDTLFLAVDEALELVPLDALAGGDGEPLGSKVALRPLVSLFDLLVPPVAEVGDEPVLLAIGGLDYDAAASAPLAVVGDAIAPPAEDSRSGNPDNFRRLLDSSTEVRTIADTFGNTFANGRADVLRKSEGGKAAFVAAAPHATFLHLATHGYFAPETVRSTADVTTGALVRAETPITGLSPLVLCGLALSGANLPPDELGRRAGILTAEEILSLDLSRCYLVTLSACDTSLGVRRAGQGYASLRAALQGAGARFVLTSLWKVGDEATMELMSDFYRRLWVQQKDPHQALWAAKMAARKHGAPFRDWAGWVLTGK